MQEQANRQVVNQAPQNTGLRRFLSWLDDEHRIGPLMTAPAVIVILMLMAYPFALSLWLSLTDTVIAQEATGNFIGLQNFATLLERSIFVNKVIPNSILYTFGSVIPKLGLGLILALVLNRPWPFRNLIRGSILLPWIVPTSLSMMAWWWMFEPTRSVLNYLLEGINFPGAPFPWRSRPDLALIAVMIINVWRGVPFFAVTLLAALQVVPEDLHEAAQIDGANRWQAFWNVDIPWIQPVIVVTTLFSLIQTFADLQIIWILTLGGPFNSTHVLATYSFQQAIKSAQIGEGAAISLFLFPALLVVIFLQLRYLQKREI